MKALVVGLGSIGRRHLSNLREIDPQIQLAVLRHRPDESDAALRAQWSADVFYALDDVLAQAKPDVAVISSPAPHHLHTALELAEAGVHLLIEKPLSHDLRGVDDLIQRAQDRGVVLLVGYNLRFCRPLQSIHSAIRAGKIGRPLGLRAEVGQYLPDWRPQADYRQTVTAQRNLGGGVLLELSHELDYATWLMGDVQSVSSHTAKLSDLELDVEDFAEITLRFRDNAIGQVHLDMVQRAAHRACRVIGTDGTLTWDGPGHHAQWYCSRKQAWSELDRDTTDRNQMYLDEMRHFLDCVAGQAEPLVSGAAGRRTLQLIAAAQESSRSGRTVEL